MRKKDYNLKWLLEQLQQHDKEYTEHYRRLNRSQQRYIRLILEGKRTGSDLFEDKSSWLWEFLNRFDSVKVANTPEEIKDFLSKNRGWGIRARFNDLRMTQLKGKDFSDATLLPFQIIADPKSKAFNLLVVEDSQLLI